MRKIIIILVLFLLPAPVFIGPVFAGEKEEITLRIQAIQERIQRLNEALYYIPFEKRAYENALKELQRKQDELNNSSEGGEGNEVEK